MKIKWKQYRDDHPLVADVVEAGLDKLEEYRERTELVPAHVLAMGMFKFQPNLVVYYSNGSLVAINPGMKLRWYAKYAPEDASSARYVFLHEVHT